MKLREKCEGQREVKLRERKSSVGQDGLKMVQAGDMSQDEAKMAPI